MGTKPLIIVTPLYTVEEEGIKYKITHVNQALEGGRRGWQLLDLNWLNYDVHLSKVLLFLEQSKP